MISLEIHSQFGLVVESRIDLFPFKIGGGCGKKRKTKEVR
jgi:hypothetical protein